MTDLILHELGERVKELTALHRTARLLQDVQRPTAELMADVVRPLPDAWQYPEITAARVCLGDRSWSTPDHRPTPWTQRAPIRTSGGEEGALEIVYLEERPDAHEGPFLREERELIDSLAELLRSYFEHLRADEALRAAHDGLERQVRERTAELRRINAALEREIAEHREAERQLQAHRDQLQRLAAELCLTEARERRRIAEDLHDHIGQALAFIKMRIVEFQGNTIFCGFEGSLAETLKLLNQTIRSTRDLTFEISPPVLYELGIGAALEWMAERFQEKYELEVDVHSRGRPRELPEEISVMLFKSAHELLLNVVKHAASGQARIDLRWGSDDLRLDVEDDGHGFWAERADDASPTGFGLFSIRERLRQLGGRVEIDSAPGRGTRVSLVAPLTRS